MNRRGAGCIEIEADLVAAAIGEADAGAEGRVAEHVAKCEPCRVEHSHYRAIDREIGAIREAPVDAKGVAQARERLETLAAEYEADELIVVTITHDPKARRRSYELLAKVFGLDGAAA